MSKPSFSDNSYALFKHMISSDKYKGCVYVWLVDENYQNNDKQDRNVVIVKAFSENKSGCSREAIKYIMSSGFLFFTHVSPAQYCPIKKGQIVINLGHGCGYKEAPIQGNSIYFDYALVPGPVFAVSKARQWGCSKEKILPIGYPRYDAFFTNEIQTVKYLEQIKGNNKKMVIWMPTFRNSGTGRFKEDVLQNGSDLPIFRTKKDIIELNEFCKKNHIKICIKRHQYQLQYSCEEEHLSNIVFICNNDLSQANVNLYNLLKYSDALLSDYSSISVDYLLLNKPIAYTLDDFYEYQKTRGFAFKYPLEYMPGYHLYEKYDFYQFLRDLLDDKDIYKDIRNEKIKDMHGSLCTQYSERILFELKRKGCQLGG